MSDFERLPPLPPELRREAERLRAHVPSADFDKRLRAALARAEAEQAARAAAPRRRTLPLIWASRIALVVPLLLVLFLFVHFGRGDDTPHGAYLHRFEAVDVVLGEEGSAWVDLDMWTHHHNGSDATVHVEAPDSVSVIPTAYARAEQTAPRCDGERCVYRFEHPNAHPDRQPVQIGIRSPGQYRIRVEHASPAARVREDLLVRVRPAPDDE